MDAETRHVRIITFLEGFGLRALHSLVAIRVSPPVIFLFLALAIMGPLLLPGYILTLDSTIAFNSDPSSYLVGFKSLATSVFAATDNSAPFSLLMQLLSNIIPLWVIHKVVLFLAFFLAAIGVARLPFLKGIGGYYAAAFYVLNPYVYVRFLAGQWGLLLGYALTPFAVKAFYDLLEERTLKNGIRVALLATLVGFAQMHSLALLAFIWLVLLLVWIAIHRSDPRRLALAIALASSVGIFLLINLYWLVPTMIDLGGGDTVLGQFMEADMALYRPRAISSLGILFDVASLHGFWRPGFLYTEDFLVVWWLPFMAMFFLGVLGFVTHVRSKRTSWMVWALGVLAILAFILALGAATSLTKPLFTSLWSIIPGFSIFRDSHKFVAILALAYAFLGGLGVQYLARGTEGPGALRKRNWRRFLLPGVLVLPLVYTFPMIGLAGQVQTTDFPSEWHDVRAVLRADQDDFHVLFLPWHMYMVYDWLPNRDKSLANPAPLFFGTDVIAGDNIEFGTFSQSVEPISRYVEFLISRSEDLDNFGELIAPLNIRYVILVNEADYEDYAFLHEQEDLNIVLQGRGITLFQNQYPTGRAYAVDSVVSLGSLEEFLEISREQDVLSHAYVLEAGKASNQEIPAKEQAPELLMTEQRGLARYRLSETDRPYTVFVTRHASTNGKWSLSGQDPELMNLGMMPTFSREGGGDTVVFTRWGWLRFLELLSLSVAALCVLYLLWPLLRYKKSRLNSSANTETT